MTGMSLLVRTVHALGWLAVLLGPQSASGEDLRTEIYAQLRRPSDLSFLDAPLSDVVARIAQAHDIEIEVDKSAIEASGMSPDSVMVSLESSDVSLETALSRIGRENDLIFVPCGEVLMMTTKERAASEVVVLTYPVADLARNDSELSELGRQIESLLRDGRADGIFRLGWRVQDRILVLRTDLRTHDEVWKFLHTLRSAIARTRANVAAPADSREAAPAYVDTDTVRPESVHEFVTLELYDQYLRGGKIETDAVNAALELVSSRTTPALTARFLTDFEATFLPPADSQSRGDTQRGTLLRLFAKILGDEGSFRFNSHKDPTGQQRATPELFQREGVDEVGPAIPPIVEALLRRAYQAQRHEILLYTRAFRAAHHPAAIGFFADVLGNTHNTSEKWQDNSGGNWCEAIFMAAVGLAELGEPSGVQWLVDHTVPQASGGPMFSLRVFGTTSDTCQENSAIALSALTGEPTTFTHDQWREWWLRNQSDLQARRFAPIRLVPFATNY